jgi:putative ABC transport system substrate-binding protein
VRRREFLRSLGGAAAVWPLAARAQEAGRHYRIAMLAPPGGEVFVDELGKAGFVEGGNLEIDRRSLRVGAAS